MCKVQGSDISDEPAASIFKGLKAEVETSFEMLVSIYQLLLSHMPEDLNLSLWIMY